MPFFFIFSTPKSNMWIWDVAFHLLLCLVSKNIIFEIFQNLGAETSAGKPTWAPQIKRKKGKNAVSTFFCPENEYTSGRSVKSGDWGLKRYIRSHFLKKHFFHFRVESHWKLNKNRL